jgi:hypothetical protein
MLSSLSIMWFTMDFLRGIKCECLRLLAVGFSGVWAPEVVASKSSRTAKEKGVAQLMFVEIVMLGKQQLAPAKPGPDVYILEGR